jgi:hypothetical protein
MDCKVHPSLRDRLINFLIEYSSLLQREQRPSLPNIPRSLDDLSIYFQTSIPLSYPIDYEIGLYQGQLAVSGSDFEKYSRVTVLEVSR